MKVQKVKISFLGDISLNGNYEHLYRQGTKPFSLIAEHLEGSIVVGNLECFSRGNQGVNELKKPRLETNLETLNYINDFHLQVACLANNHVYDHLENGFIKTTKLLEQANIRTLGASLNKEKVRDGLVIEKNDVKVGLLNYVTNDTNPKPPVGTTINVNFFKLKSAFEDIARIKKNVHHVVLIMHWGGRVEGGVFPDYDQPIIARQLIDAGADLIIGHHSHTIQPIEQYKGKYIFYSVGNFCFSDIYHEGKLYSKLSKRNKRSLIIKIDFGIGKYQFNIIPIKNVDGVIVSDNMLLKSKIRFVKKVLFVIFKKSKILWSLYFFSLKKITPIINYFFVQKGSLRDALKLAKIKRHFNFKIKF